MSCHLVACRPTCLLASRFAGDNDFLRCVCHLNTCEDIEPLGRSDGSARLRSLPPPRRAVVAGKPSGIQRFHSRSKKFQPSHWHDAWNVAGLCSFSPPRPIEGLEGGCARLSPPPRSVHPLTGQGVTLGAGVTARHCRNATNRPDPLKRPGAVPIRIAPDRNSPFYPKKSYCKFYMSVYYPFMSFNLAVHNSCK